MKPALLAFSLIALAFAADDPWSKVIAIKSGSEVSILKTGEKKPLTATFSEADSEKIIIATKNSQMSIPREEIERIEARPAGVKRLSTNQTTKSVDPNVELSKPRVPNPGSSPVPATQSSTGGVSFGKPGFELVYRKGAK